MNALIDGTVGMAGPFKSGYTPSPKSVSLPQSNSNLDELLNVYEWQYTQGTALWSGMYRKSELTPELKQLPTYTHSEIQTFSMLTQNFEGHEKYSEVTGVFITALIMKLIQVGHRYFFFDFTSLKPLDSLGLGLTRKRGHYHLMIEGIVGNSFAEGSTGGTFYVQRAGNDFGAESSRGIFYIKDAIEIANCEHYTIYTCNSTLSEYHTINLLTQEEWQQKWNQHKAKILRGRL